MSPSPPLLSVLSLSLAQHCFVCTVSYEPLRSILISGAGFFLYQALSIVLLSLYPQSARHTATPF